MEESKLTKATTERATRLLVNPATNADEEDATNHTATYFHEISPSYPFLSWAPSLSMSSVAVAHAARLGSSWRETSDIVFYVVNFEPRGRRRREPELHEDEG